MSDLPSNKHSAQLSSSLPNTTAPNIQWFCRVFDTELGPMTFETLCEMVKRGEVGPDDQVRASDACYWQPARQVAPLQSLIIANDEAAKTFGASGATKAAFPDEWFYQLDGRERGPFKLAALQELISTSGQTAEQLVIRQVGQDNWIPFYDLPDNSVYARARSGNVGSGAARCVTRTDLRAPTLAKNATGSRRSMRQLVEQNREIVVAIALWGLFNVGVLVARSDAHSTERKYFNTMRGLETEVNVLRERNGSAKEWTALRSEANKTLAPIVADLSETASASRPVRQHLLWAARDQMPKLIRSDRADKEVERLYANHMQIVERELGDP